MKIRTGDIVEVPEFEYEGKTYRHYLITFPCNEADTANMWLVDALPWCDIDGSVPDGCEVGVPTHTSDFIEVVDNLNEFEGIEDEDHYCYTCSDSGEGMADGTICPDCRGR